MSPASPQSFGIHVTKQRQIKREEHEEAAAASRVAGGKGSQVQRGSSDDTRQSETIGHKRQHPWPESGAVFQPRLKSSRSIGVHSILNPTEGGDSQRQQQQGKRPSSAVQECKMEILPPPTLPPSPQRRSSSSPLLAPISRSANAKSYLPYAGRSSVSPPHNPPRRIITPVSPAMRYASAGGNNNFANAGCAGFASANTKVSVSQAPFVPLQELSAGVYSTPGSGSGSTPPIIEPLSTTTSRISPKLAIPVPRRGHQPPPPPPHQLSRHSTPTLIHSRHPSSGLATNQSSQASSPRTPHSTTFSSFTQSSPSIASGLLPPPGQAPSLESQSLYMDMNSLSRTPSRMSMTNHHNHHQHQPQHAAPFPGPLDPAAQPQQQYNMPMIPVTIDMKSGSRSQAEKRKANSDASRRFRNRKKNEAALEQRISELNEQLQCMAEERDFYRTERDFFRDMLGRHVGAAQMPSRPSSPSPSRRFPGSASTTASPAPQSAAMMMMGGEDMSKSVSAASSLASTPHVLPSPESATRQHPNHPSAYADSWQNGTTPAAAAAANGDYYREDPRFATRRS